MDHNTKSKIDIINLRIKEMNSLYHLAAMKSNISDGEVSIWTTLLNGEKDYSQQDLCEILSLPKQTINSLISGLKKKGYVELEHIPGSRNRKVIRLTEKGRLFADENVIWIIYAQEKAMEETNSQEVEVCISMLEKYIAKFRDEVEAHL